MQTKRRRLRGRPPISPGEKSVTVTVRIPESQYDRLDKTARQEGVTIPDLLRLNTDFYFRWRTERDLLIAYCSRFALTSVAPAHAHIRLLVARAQTPNPAAAIKFFCEHWPTDPIGSWLLSALKFFNQTNGRNPGKLSDSELWVLLDTVTEHYPTGFPSEV